jgi:hypothetical protein
VDCNDDIWFLNVKNVDDFFRIAYDMKGAQVFFIFIFQTLPNLAKWSYG